MGVVIDGAGVRFSPSIPPLFNYCFIVLLSYAKVMKSGAATWKKIVL